MSRMSNGREQIHVREAQPREYDVIGDLTVRAYEPVDPTLYTSRYDEELRDVATRSQHSVSLVASFGNHIVGAVSYVADDSSDLYEFDEPGVSFRYLAVDPSARGLGAGSRLVDECVRRAERTSEPRVLIHSLEAMVDAQRIYRAKGFERDPSIDRLWDKVRGLGFRLELSNSAAY